MHIGQFFAVPLAWSSAHPKSGSLRSRAAIGTLWSLIGVGIGQALRLGSNLIMTRLLLPEAFGLMAMVTTLQVGLTLISDVSIHRSVVQSKMGDTSTFLRVAWVVQIARGLMIAALAVIAAMVLSVFGGEFAPAGSIYADPTLPGLIALSAVGLLITGFESPNKFLAARRLEYGRLTILDLTSQVVSLVAMIVLGLIYSSVWALLIGSLIGGAFRMVLTHVLFSGPRMSFTWDAAVASEMWLFGRWLLLSSSVTFFVSFADRIIFGALFDAATFSYYAIGRMWVDAVVGVLLLIIDRIAFPLLSEQYRSTFEKLRSTYGKLSIVVGIACFLMFLFCAIALPHFVRFVYRSEFERAAEYIPLLAVAALFSKYTLDQSLVLSAGRSKIVLMYSLVVAITVVVALPFGYGLFGVVGGVAAFSLREAIAVPMIMSQRRHIVGGNYGVDLVYPIAVLGLAATLLALHV